eukprot:3941118-Amphidinium_carterae.1
MRFIGMLAAASKSTKSKVALCAHLASKQKVNQLNLVGFCRWLVELRPWCNEEHMKVALAAMAYFERVGIRQEYSVEMGHMRPWWDEVVTHHFTQMRKVSYVLDMELVKKVLATTAWSDVEADISRLVRSSNLGARLFGFTFQFVAAGKVDKVVADWIAELLGKPPVEVTAALKAEWQSELSEKLEESVAEDPGPRTVDMHYRGM